MLLRTFTNKDEFINATLDLIAETCNKHPYKYRFSIGLSGGTTPIPIYQSMRYRLDIPFEKIKFYQVDERYVPKTHKKSNYRIIKTTLIDSLKKEYDFHFFDTELPIDESIHKYELELKKISDKKFDLCILGLGIDGHTASLFPLTKALHEENRWTALTITKTNPIKDRLTITFPFILRSHRILLLISGKEKEKILDELLHSNKTIDELPAKALLTHANLIINYLL